MRSRGTGVALAAMLGTALMAPATALAAETAASECSDYLRYVPLEYPKIVRETPASAELQLWGDRDAPTYSDTSPRDGIDDARHAVLMRLAARFAPYLVKNTQSAPIDFRVFYDVVGGFDLYIDTWNIAAAEPPLIGRAAVDLSDLGEPCADSGVNWQAFVTSREPRSNDCKLLALLREFRPDDPALEALRQAAVDARTTPFSVLYVDFPGSDAESWREEYLGVLERLPPRRYQHFEKAYVHPFVRRTESVARKTSGYELFIQYWFFYPFNDGANNHEGDWEHIAVVVSPLSLVGRAMRSEELRLVLDGDWPDADPLVMKRIEYYFHRKVMVFDFAEPSVYQPREAWERELEHRGEERAGERDILTRVRERAYLDEAETRINTHPIVFIGGDAKGLDQIYLSPGVHNRDSHASYPFPGVFKNVGPTSSSEVVTARFDFRAYLGQPRALPWRVVSLAEPARLQIVPDWERVMEPMLVDASLRRDWQWLVLPMRWGCPAAPSPAAGIVPHADTGNLAPFGPAYNEGWNRPAPNAGYVGYEPHRLPWYFPLGFQDNFSNRLGYLNIPVALLISVPPFDFIWRVLALPARAAFTRHEAVYFPEKRVPPRNMSVEAGISVEVLPNDFAALLLNRDQFPEWFRDLNELDPSLQQASLTPVLSVGTAVAQTYRVTFNMGEQFTSENTLNYLTEGARIDIGLTNRSEPAEVRATLKMWEWAGSLRYNIGTGRLQPFVKGGYGLAWYKLQNATFDGSPLEHPSSPWVLQFVWHVGAGLDLILVRGPVLGLGARVGYTLYNHDLGLDEIIAPGLAPLVTTTSINVHRSVFDFALELTF